MPGLTNLFPQPLTWPVGFGLQPCTRTHLKKAVCYTHPVGWTYDKYQFRRKTLHSNQLYLTGNWTSCRILFYLSTITHQYDYLRMKGKQFGYKLRAYEIMERDARRLMSKHGILHQTTQGYLGSKIHQPASGVGRNKYTSACFCLSRENWKCLTLTGASSICNFGYHNLRLMQCM